MEKFKFWRPYMATTLCQFPANFRFSGAQIALALFWFLISLLTIHKIPPQKPCIHTISWCVLT